MNNNEVIIYNTPKAEIQPFQNDYSIKINEYTATLKRDVDFGMILRKDGTPISEKPTLFKSGCEKILMGYGLRYDIEITDSYKDYKDGLFYYECKAIAWYGDNLVRCGVGCCNTREKAFGSASSYDSANSALKKAKKRALVDLALSIASCSDMFVQDLEDTKNEERAKKMVSDEDFISAQQKKRIFAIASGKGITVEKAKKLLAEWGFQSTSEIKVKDYDAICDKLQNYEKE